MSFKTEIEAIVGDIDSPDYTTQAGLFLTEGVKFITKSLMNVPEMMERLTSTATLTNIAPTLDTSNILKILTVTRYDTNRNREAIRVFSNKKDDYLDINSIYYASKLDPKYYIENDTLHVIPTPLSDENASVKKIEPDSSVVVTDVSIDNLPSELERGVILYASKELLRLFLNNRNVTLRGLSLANISSPSNISISGVSYSDASAGDASAATVSAVTIGSVSDADVTTSNPNISALPVYVEPSLSIDYSQLEIGGSGDASGVDDFILGEDVELAQTVLAKHEQQIQKYQLDIQNQANEFNEKVTNYQVEVQEELQKQNVALERARVDATTASAKAQQDAQMATEIDQINKQKDLQLSLQNKSKALEAAISDNNLKVANYQAQVESYAQQVNEAIQTYTLAFQEVVQDYNWYVQQYQICIQDLVAFISQYIPQQPQEMSNEIAANDRSN